MSVMVTVTDEALIPAKAKPTDACYDLRAAKMVSIPAGGRAVIPTGARLRMPEGIAAHVLPRSGLSSKGLVVIIGTIDTGYVGEIGVIAQNMTDDEWTVCKHDRIAQLKFFLTLAPVLQPVDAEEFDALEETDRGADGFGSTGVR